MMSFTELWQQFERTGSSGDVSIAAGADSDLGLTALVVAALADGESTIRALPSDPNLMKTAAILRAFGVHIENDDQTWRVRGCRHWEQVDDILFFTEYNTAAAMLIGILVGKRLPTTIEFEAGVEKAGILKDALKICHKFNAKIKIRDGFLQIMPKEKLKATDIRLPYANQRLKAMTVLLNCFVEGEAAVKEPFRTDDRLERLLILSGVRLESCGKIENSIVIAADPAHFQPFEVTVPPNIATVAPHILLSVLSGGRIRLENVSLNTARTGMLRVLAGLGAEVEIENQHYSRTEPIGDVTVKSAVLYEDKQYGRANQLIIRLQEALKAKDQAEFEKLAHELDQYANFIIV